MPASNLYSLPSLLVVEDASGKGLAGAPIIANVRSSLRTAALFTGNDLAALLRVVDRFAALFYGVFGRAT